MPISVNVELGHHNTVRLSRAILIYENARQGSGGPSDTFASVHKVRYDGTKPLLEPGTSITLEAALSH